MLVADWFNYEMQTVTLLGGLHYLIWHFYRKSHHSMFSTSTLLYYITNTLLILAQYNLVRAALKLATKDPPLLKN